MKRVVLLCSLLVLADCEFAQKHPAVTVGVTTGVLGWGGCEMAVAKIGTCTVVGGAAGLFLGGITALVYAIADPNAHELTTDEDDETPIQTGTPPPPGLPPGMTPPASDLPPPPGVVSPDAGTGAALVDAGVPATSFDAGPR
jgi:hypothetical protein